MDNEQRTAEEEEVYFCDCQDCIDRENENDEDREKCMEVVRRWLEWMKRLRPRKRINYNLKK